MNQSVSVSDCLLEAGTMLQSAMEKLENGEPLDEKTGANTTPPEPVATDDPDDLAAAFFAQHAQKQQEESRIPANEWARTIFANAERKTALSAKTSTHSKKNPNDDMVNELYEEFQKGMETA